MAMPLYDKMDISIKAKALSVIKDTLEKIRK